MIESLRHTFYKFDERQFASAFYLVRRYGFRRAARFRGMAKRAVVIGGCARSGTTLLLSILSCHPRIACIPHETGAFSQNAGRIRFVHLYDNLAATSPGASAVRLCEKTPRNVHNIPAILRLLGPCVRFVHIVRDPREVVTSRHPDKQGLYVPPSRWVEDVAAGAAFRRHPQVLTVRYEDLVSEPEAALRVICSFVGEDYAPEFARYPETAVVRSSNAWAGGSARAVGRESERRWERPENREAIEALLAEPGAAKLMEELGYHP